MSILNASILNALGLSRPAPARRTSTGNFEIAGVTLINPMVDRRKDTTIKIEQGRITELSTAPSEASAGYAGFYALPGLVDLHVHLPPANALKLTPHSALLYIAHGVTTIREAGDLDGTAASAARALAAEGAHPVPRIFSCGPFVGAGRRTFRNTILLESASDEEAETAALRVKATGASFMKFYDGLTEPMIRSLERACDRHGLRIMGHVPGALAYEAARIREVQHFFGVPEPTTLERNALVNRSCDWQDVDEARMEAIVEATLRHGIANTPTIVTNQKMLRYRDFDAAIRELDMRLVPRFYRDVVWHPDIGRLNTRISRDYLERQVVPCIDKKKQLAKKLFDAGAQLYLGTDVAQPFVIAGRSLLEEMANFVDAGISLENVWKLATSDAGERLGQQDLGKLEQGAPADVLLFRKDPTLSLQNLASLEAVVVAGALYRMDDLQRAIDCHDAYYAAPLIRAVANRGAKQALANTFSSKAQRRA